MTETEWLFTEVLNCNRLDLYLNKNAYLDMNKRTIISSAIKRRILGEPIQYILGKAEFMGLEFKVNRDVFIPRPETEILVETVIKLVSSIKYQVSGINILDVGTGSGCIAVSLAKFINNLEITATDISSKALEVASMNAKLNNVEINFVQGGLFDTYPLSLTPYHLIISNPPYISTSEIESLQPEIRYEPRMALDGGKDGLDFYRKIIQRAPECLKEDGFLIMEMGFGQAEMIKNILKNLGNFEIIDVVKDYNSIERVIVAKNG